MKHRSSEQALSIYRKAIGAYTLTMLVDGFLEVDFAMLLNIDKKGASSLLEDARRSPAPRLDVAAFLLQGEGRTVLIDGGDATSATTGRLMSALTGAGISPTEIDTVLLTHAHPDHIGALATVTGVARFPNAELMLHKDELEFWSDDSAMNKAPDMVKPFFMAARNVFAAYKANTKTFKSGELFKGVTVRSLPGHTPGHSGFVIESEGERVFLWGDITHFPDVQVPHPEVGTLIDVDPKKAIETRIAALQFANDEGIVVTGPHVPFPGFLRIKKGADGYTSEPQVWSPVP